MHSDIRQPLTIDHDAGQLEAGDELAVRQTTQASRGIDARDPQGTELPGTGAAITVGVVQRVQHRFMAFSPQTMTCTLLTFCQLENGIVFSPEMWSGF